MKLLTFSTLVILSTINVMHHLHAKSELHEGVLYEHVRDISDSVSLHCVTLDSRYAALALGIAHDKCNSSQKVSEIAKKHNALVAINGSFFDFGQKSSWYDSCIKMADRFGYNTASTYPVFCLKKSNDWYALSIKEAGIIGWKNQGRDVIIDTVKNQWRLRKGNTVLTIADINKPYAQGPILYTHVYDSTTPTKSSVTEFIIVEGKILEIRYGGNTNIPHNGCVYAVEEIHLKTMAEGLYVGDELILEKLYNNMQHDWEAFDYLVGSTPLLIKNSCITETVLKTQTPFFIDLHPRTAVGVLANGHLLFVVADGRQKHSRGMSLLDLSQFLLERGCVHALNLDGGGSSVMVINGKIVNQPSGREGAWFKVERNISHCLMIIPRSLPENDYNNLKN